MLEAPTLRIPTINVGERQKGRAKAKSVFNCPPKKRKILTSLKKILNKKRDYIFKNPYGEGGASKKIVNILEKTKYENLLKKKFYNIR